MQDTPAGSRKFNKTAVENFKFQPTLHSNNMKKFIISKIEHNETANRATPTIAPEFYPPAQICKNEKVKPEIQPPLPVYPPPPDKLPNLNITLKKEVEDMEYNTSNVKEAGSEERRHDKNKPQRAICRDFVRGKCTRIACRFSHERDTSQLDGVYTFCRDFQNSVCTHPNCKYVHATVFEEQHFYRTAELPPHATAHHKNVPPPPPPPPLQEVTPSTSGVNIPAFFNSPPPALPMRIEKPTSVISCIPASKMDSRNFVDDFRALPLAAATPSTSKRDLFGCTSRDPDVSEPTANKCKYCDDMEFRLQYNKEKVEKKKQDSNEMAIKLINLNQKKEKLYAVLVSLLKPAFPTSSNAENILNPASNITGDRDMNM